MIIFLVRTESFRYHVANEKLKNKHMKVFSLLSLILIQSVLFGQVHDIYKALDTSGPGKITIVQDSSIYRMMQTSKEINQHQNGIPNGYRIQIFSASGNQAREDAIKFKEDFLLLHPEFDEDEIYQLYQPPFFKLRVGDYRNESDALIVYKSLVKDYPDCYIVRSPVNFPRLTFEKQEP